MTSDVRRSTKTSPPEHSALAPELLVKDVSKEFDQISTPDPFLAVDNISMEVQRAKFVSVIGPSGCGKSTLLRLLAGLETPTKGVIVHRGELVEGPHMSRGFIFQGDAVFPWLTVQKNVEFGLKCRGVNRAEREELARFWCDAVGLADSVDSFPKELSGGMRKRVDLARVYANDPSVLLMDEPFGALDAQTKEELQVALLRIWEGARKTIVFVTHDVDEAIFLSDAVVVMSKNPGQIASTIPINIERPRLDDSRTSHLFAELRVTLRGCLREVGVGADKADWQTFNYGQEERTGRE